MADVIVLGAGIAGLAAAQRLIDQGADVHVFEKSAFPGGCIRTVQRQGWRHESGPNSFLGSAGRLHQLAEDAGLKPIEAAGTANKRYLFLDGKLQALPMGPLGAIGTRTLPFSAKLRVLKEPFLHSKPDDNESVRTFFERQMGKEVTERFVDAFVSGIYAGDISQLGIAAVFPKAFEAVKMRGSVIRGFMAMRKASPAPRSTRRGTFSFAGGLGDLPNALAKNLGGRLHLETDAAITRSGGLWRVRDLAAPALIVATQSGAASQLLAPQAPGLARALDVIGYSPMAGVHLLYRKEDVTHPLDGFGFLIPRREKVRLLGCIWSSALFDVCGKDQVALTCFIGGAHDPEVANLREEELQQLVRADLERTMGVKAPPVDAAVVKHLRAIPQYALDHVSRRSEIRRLASEVPGLYLAGAYLEGASMNDTIIQGERAAADALAYASGHREARAA